MTWKPIRSAADLPKAGEPLPDYIKVISLEEGEKDMDKDVAKLLHLRSSRIVTGAITRFTSYTGGNHPNVREERLIAAIVDAMHFDDGDPADAATEEGTADGAPKGNAPSQR